MAVERVVITTRSTGKYSARGKREHMLDLKSGKSQ